MLLESLAKKRADLCATREQYVGQINRTNGAIDLLDDLIAEAQQEEEALAAMQLPIAWVDTAAEAVALAPYEFPDAAPSLAPVEMLPVTYDAPAGDAA